MYCNRIDMVKFNKDHEPTYSEFHIDAQEMILLYRALSYIVVSRITIDEDDIESVIPFVNLLKKIRKQLDEHNIEK